jgi:hypothetical protein
MEANGASSKTGNIRGIVTAFFFRSYLTMLLQLKMLFMGNVAFLYGYWI